MILTNVIEIVTVAALIYGSASQVQEKRIGTGGPTAVSTAWWHAA
jgi:hypothetical protein